MMKGYSFCPWMSLTLVLDNLIVLLTIHKTLGNWPLPSITTHVHGRPRNPEGTIQSLNTKPKKERKKRKEEEEDVMSLCSSLYNHPD